MTDHIIGVTKRTRIEQLSLDDAPFMLALVNTPGWLEHIGDRDVHYVADAERFLKNGFLKSRDDHGFTYYGIRTEDGDPFGIVGFLKKPYLENVDFGFALLPEYQGRGYAKEASEAVLKYGRRKFGFKLLDAVTTKENRPSMRLLEKLRFRLIGTVQADPDDQPLQLYRFP